LGDEIWEQTEGQVDAFVHMISTAHSIHGVSRALRRFKPDLPVFGVEPAESAVLGPSARIAQNRGSGAWVRATPLSRR
jgi:cysteine synthase